MKKVLDPSTVAHYWANKIQDEARTATSNLFFNRETIYSYGHHFEIAKHVTNEHGNNAILFTQRTYSKTTSKHLHIVKQACSHKTLLFVPAVENTPAQNFAQWAQNIQGIGSCLLSARKPEKYIREIQEINVQINRYCFFFGYEIPALLLTAMGIINRNDYISFLNTKVTIETEEATMKAKKEAEQHKKDLKLWLSGKGYTRLYRHNGFDYLRIRNNIVETSQGICLEISEAKRLHEALKIGALKIGQRILAGYEVSEITAKNIRIGCHNFKRSTINQFAKKLN